MNQYAKRKINLTFNYGKGPNGEDRGDDVTLTGLRVSAQMVDYNGDAQGTLQLRIFGLTLETANQLTAIGPVMEERRNNRITVTAGEDGGAMATVYQGTIDSAFGDFNGAPDVVFNVVALAAAFEAVKAVPARDYGGGVDAAVIMADLAKTMGMVFENNGVSVILTDRTYNGTALEQVKECARDARINYTIEMGKLAIWPKRGYRAGEPVKVSPETGMVGYPSFSSQGIVLTTLFNPDVRLGGRVSVTSELTPACGLWNVYKIAHVLESETPNGQWFTQIACTPSRD
ncbi:MAG: hypothetical protein WAW69_06200 [Polaromonas sp.]